MAVASSRKQVNMRMETTLYQALETIARQERRSVPQIAHLLMEEGLQRRMGGRASSDDVPGAAIASLATAGGAFDWLADEPDLYDDTCGEPV